MTFSFKTPILALFIITPIFTSGAQAAPSKIVHEKLTDCMSRLYQTMDEDRSQVQNDRDHSQLEAQEIESELNRKWGARIWAEKIYDYFSRGTWDWQHPKNEKTLTGKVRALIERTHNMDAKLSQLREMRVMRTKASDQLEFVLSRLDKNKPATHQEWADIRSYLRTLDQEYYDFINDLRREKVHEQGFADQVNWNKTMGLLQETFYRDISCVTVMDQVVLLIPDKLLIKNESRLAVDARAEQNSSKEVMQ